MTLVDVRKRQSKTVPYKEIERYGIDCNRSPAEVRTEDAEVTENYYARRNRDGEISLAPLEVSPGFRGKPDLMPSQCIACGACACACPANALTIQTDDQQNSRTWQLYLGRCIYCGRCGEVCPTRAIQLTNNFELTVTNKADLYTRATFHLQRCSRCERPFAPQKTVALAAELLAQQQKCATKPRNVMGERSVCPECKQRATLLNDDTDVPLVAKEQRISPVLTQYVSQPITLHEQTQKMKRHLLQDIRRSAYVYRVDCGGCNACEIEIFAAITPVFDAERFGIKVVSSPRHADILLFTGALTRAMRMPPLRRTSLPPL